MRLEICTYPDPVLDKVSEPVEEITDELKELAQNMVETMYEDRGIGLAAPQVGENIRLICVDVSGPETREELMIIFNPVIEEREGTAEREEGCLSVPALSVKVPRAAKIVVTGQDENGNDIRIEADDLLSCCIQHEIDHLDGKLILDSASRLKRSMYEQKVQKWLKRQKRSK